MNSALLLLSKILSPIHIVVIVVPICGFFTTGKITLSIFGVYYFSFRIIGNSTPLGVSLGNRSIPIFDSIFKCYACCCRDFRKIGTDILYLTSATAGCYGYCFGYGIISRIIIIFVSGRTAAAAGGIRAACRVFVVITGAYGRLLNRRLLLAHAGIIRIIPLFALRIRRIVLANFFLSLGCRFRVGLFLCFGIRRVYFRLLVVFNRSDTFSRSGRNAENRSQRIARCGSDTAADGCALLSGIGRLGRNIRYCRTGLGNRVNLVQSLLSLIIGKVGNLVAVNRSFALFKFRLGPFLLFGRQVAGGKFLFEFVDTVLVFLVKGKFSSGFACILNIVGY